MEYILVSPYTEYIGDEFMKIKTMNSDSINVWSE